MKTELTVDFKKRQEVEQDCKLWAEQIRKEYKPDIVLFIAKSGYIFGSVLSNEFDCPLIYVTVSRPNNKKMDVIKRFFPKVPRNFLSYYLKKKVSNKNYPQKTERFIQKNNSLDVLHTDQYSKVLIIDDSVDTGWTLNKVIDMLRNEGYEGMIKTASYCVLSQAVERTNIDFYRFMDRIVVTATSRYSSEYNMFLSDYEKWKQRFEEIN